MYRKKYNYELAGKKRVVTPFTPCIPFKFRLPMMGFELRPNSFTPIHYYTLYIQALLPLYNEPLVDI